MSTTIKNYMKHGDGAPVRAVGTIFADNTPAIILADLDGQMVTRASVNVGELHSETVHLHAKTCHGKDVLAAIKDYAENEGVLRTLVEGRIVSITPLTIDIGHVSIPVCRIICQQTLDEMLEASMRMQRGRRSA